MRIPAEANIDVRTSFREVWDVLDSMTLRNIDLKGHRITNAGRSVDASDYVTRQELQRNRGGSTLSGVEPGVGLIMRLDGTRTITGNRTVSGTFTFSAAPPFAVDDTTVVTNLNADLLDGVQASAFIQGTLESGSGNVMRLDGTSDVTGARRFTGACRFSQTLEIEAGAPQLLFDDTTVGDDDFRVLVDGDEMVFARNAGAGWATQFYVDSAGTFRVVSGDLLVSSSYHIVLGNTDTPTTDPGWTSSSTSNMNAPDGYFLFRNSAALQDVVVPYWNT